MAFPFVWLAITMALMASTGQGSIWEWLYFDVLCRIAMGFILGRGVAYMLFRLPKKIRYFHAVDGFTAIFTMLLVYAITELLHGYGFLAVFVAAIVIRNFEFDHKHHKVLHSFTDQAGRILVAIVLLLFGGSLAGDWATYPEKWSWWELCLYL